MKIWARGIDTKLFSPIRRDHYWREKMGFAEDDIVVSFVSRLVWEKELGTYIESVHRIQQRNPKVRALVVGDGPAKQEAQKNYPMVFLQVFVQEKTWRARMLALIYFYSLHIQKLLVT